VRVQNIRINDFINPPSQIRKGKTTEQQQQLISQPGFTALQKHSNKLKEQGQTPPYHLLGDEV
jgi:hypothetical protein